MDNVFIERLWRSLKYECVFLNYNQRRPHSTFGGKTPDEVYATVQMTERLAA